MSDSSKITTDLVADSPIQLDANYRMDIHDRRYLDNQIIGTQQHVEDSLLSGFNATWGLLDSSSASVVIGDCIVVKGNNVTKATGTDLLNAGAVLGVACISALPNTKVRYIIGGSIPATISGLSTGLSESVICNSSTARLQRTASVGPTDFQVGFASTTGAVTMTHGSGSGGGGGGSSVTSFVIDGTSGAVSAGQWVVQTDSVSDPPTCALITTANFSKGVIGMALQSGAPLGTILVATTGQVAKASITGLGTGTAGYIIVNTSTGLSNRKNVPSFQDIIGGTTDAHGNVTVSVLQSRIGQLVVDPRDYGGTDNIVVDSTQAILSALADSATLKRPLRLCNSILSKPLRVNTSSAVISGHGEGLTTIVPNFYGPWCVVGPDLTDLPPVLNNGPVLGGVTTNALNVGQGRNYCVDLRMCGCGELAGLTAFTIEAWVYLTAPIADAAAAVIASSAGQEHNMGGGFDEGFIFMIEDIASIPSELFLHLNVGGTTYAMAAGTSLSTATWHHVAASWDGTTIRMFIDGVSVGTPVTTATGAVLTQKQHEGVHLGRTFGLIVESSYFDPQPKLHIGPTRGSSAGIYTTGFSPPTTLFPTGSASDLWVINWDEGLAGTSPSQIAASDVYKGWHGNAPVWFPTKGGRGTLDHELDSCAIRDLTVTSGLGVTTGGVFIQQTLHYKLWKYRTETTWFHCWARDNSFESHAQYGFHNGTFRFPGYINFTTSGDVIENYNVQNCSYPYVLSGGNELIDSTIGTWGAGCAGVYLQGATVNIVNCFWDAEGQPYPTRGGIMAWNSALNAHGIQLSGGNVIDNVAITLDTVDADLEFRTQSVSFNSAIVDILGAASNQVKLKGLDYGTSVPAVVSSNGAPLGKVFIEGKTAGDPVGASIRNQAGLDQRHGDANTTGNTPTTLADCSVQLDPHSTVVIDAEIVGQQTDGSQQGVWKISEIWKRGSLGTAPSLVTAMPGSPSSGGSNSGSIPVSWSAALVGDGVSKVNPTVTGVAATNISWSGNIVVNKRKNNASTWTPIELAPSAWFRGDVGTVSSWTDQSGNGHNAPAGTTAPTTTTLGGQSAFNFAGGAWFQSSASNLVTAGGNVTVLAVAQMLDAVGGCLWGSRLDTSPLDCVLLHTGGITYISSSGGGGGGATLVENNGVLLQPRYTYYEGQSPFLAEWSFYQQQLSVRAARFEMNRIPRGPSGLGGVESGSTGFIIGKSGAYGQPWNGVIAELIILDRTITSDERVLWQSYVNSRYGI